MEDVFYLTRGWRNATYILFGAIICLFVTLLTFSFFNPFLKQGILFILPVSLIVIGLSVCAILQVNEKIFWDNDRVRKVSRLVNREILLEDIKGYKFAWNYLHIIPHKGKGKRILVSTYVCGMRLLHAELVARYPDLKQQKG
ncbi:hypothetical protein [Chitinophaga pinensis]|uniref:Uncharacterized protein n=1 Tax=Chitinophaga pinensis (strain ATCC 43595 / DSM 2588 / LMG 13176 / NBRC 15968 / NCIMB 11800 / UQM 2034) TaxID=485918 RepID=A0A979GW42_CHIPD|nr:hypothetical protein [Chitinophaga pinensis]ACU61759.1 hypothetical protein Cpin_4311 [Chitinophaga pinensis DSM 2588]